SLYLEADGSIGDNWSESGELLLTGLMDNNIEMIKDGYGGIIIGSLSEEGTELYLQRYDKNANLLWGINGIVHEELDSEDDFALLNWGEGEYAVVARQDNQYLANVIDASGDLQYAEMQLAGEPSAESREGFRAVVTSDDKLGLIWEEGIGETTTLVLQKSAIGGELEWEDSSYLCSYYTWNLKYIKFMADDGGGLRVFLKECSDDFLMLYFHYNSDGELLSGDEPVIIGNSYVCPYGSNEYQIGIAESEVTGIFWTYSSDDDADDFIKFQYIDADDNMILEEGGVVLHSVLSGTTYQSYLDTNGENSIITWRDNRFEPSQIYVQLINDYTGENGFTEFGIPITDRPEKDQDLKSTCFSNDGETFCTVFTTDHTDSFDEYCGVQIMDLAGNRLLGDEGHSFINEDEDCLDACVGAFEDGFAISWSTTNNDYMNPVSTLHLERIIDNAPVWGGGIEVIQYNEGDINDIHLAGDMVIWVNAYFPSSQIKVLRLDDNGQPAIGWAAEGIVIGDNYNYQDIKVINCNEGVLVFWREIDSWSNNYRGQYISNAGELLWEDGGHGFLSDDMYLEEVKVYEDEIYILYNDAITNELVIGKYDMEGNAVWSENTAVTAGTCYSSLDIWQDIMVVYWTDMDNEDLYAKIFNTDGSLVSGVPEEGIIVCQHSYNQRLVSSGIDDAGNSIVLWRDNRGAFLPEPDPALFIQRIDLTTLAVSEENIDESYLVQISNYPNPFTGSTTLRCDLPREMKDAQIDIYNIRGQKVRSLSAERNEVEWDCRNAAGKLVGAGIYLYQLSGDGIGSKVSRMILIK
ncbi:MAG: T9SS type A sorting domain-containing protein, partial [Candidatus Stygibacter australis]|nr:T9SS type A sorting domain-containing protein [Candidatus Stygibacter australis]